MLSERTLRRLRWHAGFEQLEEKDVPSVAKCTYRSGNDVPDVRKACADLMSAMTSLNFEVNGPCPSKDTSTRLSALPIGLVYAITEILRMLREPHGLPPEDREFCKLAAWRAETAWSAILAGDIDNIAEHVREEESWRFR